MCGHSFHPGTQRPLARGPRFRLNGRDEFGLLVYTISQNALLRLEAQWGA